MALFPVLDGSVDEKPDVVAVIDLEELEQDRRDTEWRAFLDEAQQYRASLRANGRLE